LAQEQIFKNMVDSIVNLDEEKAINLANKAIKENMNLVDVIEKGYAAGV
jgi:methanogenic corrinoid protein MtbC1